MRKYFLVLFVCLLPFLSESQTTYYVSASGNDANNGTSEATPWQTSSKVNGSSFLPGDNVLFKRGDTFYGSITIAQSGTSSSRITIGAYGTGVKPVITGLQTVSVWTDNGGGVYKAPFSKSRLEVVSFQGKPQQMGRWPNKGSWRTYNASTSTTITDANTLTGSWVGAEAVIRKTRWTLDRNDITGQSGNTLTFTPANSDNVPTNGCGYFIQNSLATLDTLGEWYNDGSNLYVYFGANSPTSYTVKAAQLDNLLYLNHSDYVTVKNIQFTGSDSDAIVTSVANHVFIDSCDFNLQGNAAIEAGWGSTYLTVTNCTFKNSYTDAVWMANNCAGAVVNYNIVDSVNIFHGSGTKALWDIVGDGLAINSDGAVVTHNTVTNCGHNGIRISEKATVSNNDVSYVGLTRYDAGAIYTWTPDHDLTGTVIENNNIHDCMGNYIMWLDNPFVGVEGVYLDDTRGVSILNNTITNVESYGVVLNNYDAVQVQHNTIKDARSFSLFLSPLSTASMSVNVTQNTFITTHAPLAYYNLSISSQPTNYGFINYSSNYHASFPSIGIIDSNHFYRTLSSDILFNTYLSADAHWYGTNRTLSDWQTFTSLDANSDITTGIPGLSNVFLQSTQSITAITYSTATVTLQGVKAKGITGPYTYQWTQTSGGSATIVSPTSFKTKVSGMSGGVYIFQIVATDGSGHQSKPQQFRVTVYKK